MAGEHSGHRERMRKKFLENGFDTFEPHEVLEFYLYYAIQRRDTNPLAHRLLDRYITIGGVCDAPIDELKNDFGLSENTAVYLKMLPHMARLYTESKLSDDCIVDYENIGSMFQTKFIGRTNEEVALMLFDAKGKLIYFGIVSKGSISAAEVPIRKIVALSLQHNAKTAFVAHNHPGGSALPSNSDLNVTQTLRETLGSVGVELFDHFIITDDDYVSLRESELSGYIFAYDD